MVHETKGCYDTNHNNPCKNYNPFITGFFKRAKMEIKAVIGTHNLVIFTYFPL